MTLNPLKKTLNNLLKNLPDELIIQRILPKEKYQISVTSICQDHRKMREGALFVAICGETFDSHNCLKQVFKHKPSALLIQHEQNIDIKSLNKNDIPIIKVKNSRLALSLLACEFYNHPSNSLFCIGITGTNGKTSTSYFLQYILNASKSLCGLIGTNAHNLGKESWTTQMTTPDPLNLQSRLNDFVEKKSQCVVMEVSSHALSQKRVHGTQFDALIFTQFTQDHLDYHKDMKDYFLSKELLFKEIPSYSKKKPFVLINNDDPMSKKINVQKHLEVLSYGQNKSDFCFKILKSNLQGTNFHLTAFGKEQIFFLPIIGVHNVYNAVAAIGVALKYGLSLEFIASALKTIDKISGRLQKISNSLELTIFVDFAHTEGALNATLKSLKPLVNTGGRLITVFGCGGGRDKSKRLKMSQVALKHSDQVFLTSDNPREENPLDIIKEATQGLNESQLSSLTQIVDRKKAISKALQWAQKGDIILIAGKGHETHQEISGVRYSFSDVEITRKICQLLENKLSHKSP